MKLTLHLCIIFLLYTKTTPQSDREYSYQDDISSSVFDNTYDLVNGATLYVNSTCGLNRKEYFCKLITVVQTNESSCDYCWADERDKSHGIEFAKSDKEKRWWQSASLENGLQHQRVEVLIDLKEIFLVNSFSMAVADSPPPEEWILEASVDNTTYKRWVCFAASKSACRRLCGQNVQVYVDYMPYKLEDQETYCTTYFSQILWSSDQEIAVRLTDGRANLQRIPQDLTPQLIDFLSARYIRLSLRKMSTMSSTSMGVSRGNELPVDVFNKLYYTIKKIMINGKCQCNQHSETCEQRKRNGVLETICQCQHNTCGSKCETCCTGYHQSHWSPGKPCEKCNCNGKTDECFYNKTVENHRLSRNMAGNLIGGGQCLNCRENTAGVNCETCKEGFYRPYGVLPENPNPCQPCDCNIQGSTGTCVRDDEDMPSKKSSTLSLDLRPGDCICREGYRGKKCSECAEGYYPASGSGLCTPCECNLKGSHRENNYACFLPCNCKLNTDPTAFCSRCLPGFFGLDENKREGCTPCFCFGITNQCRSLEYGSVQTRAGPINSLEGWMIGELNGDKTAKPHKTIEGYPQFSKNDAASQSPSSSSTSSPFFETFYWVAPSLYHGNLLSMYGSKIECIIKLETAISQGTAVSGLDILLKGNGKYIGWHRMSRKSDQMLHIKYEVPLEENGGNWFLLDNGQSQPATKEHIMTVLANVTDFKIKGKHFVEQITSDLRDVTITVADRNAVGQLINVEKCDCPPEYVGTSCESCAPGFTRLQGLYKGICVPCRVHCNGHSEQCDPDNGQCFNCQHQTTGKTCDQCEKGYYGDAKRGTENDCKRCECPLLDYQLAEECHSFGPLGRNKPFACIMCNSFSHGVYCHTCLTGYYGNPLLQIPCQPCNCSENQLSCDSVTGECNCGYNTDGTHCEKCKVGYYLNGKTCTECQCSTYGSYDESVCNPSDGSCTCKKNFIGKLCETCNVTFGGVNEGCPPCQCNYIGSESTLCDQTTGNCKCKPGVEGKYCDKCKPGYFDFSSTGCKTCPLCQKGQICDPINGQCRCPDNTEGPFCEKCKSDSWNFTVLQGCQKCECYEFGSKLSSCNNITGDCECKSDFQGRDCKTCVQGHWGSKCEPCSCSSNGTEPSSKVIDFPGLYQCNELNGSCTCKQNVEGPLCDKCKSGTVNLRGPDPNGCQNCFCFGFTKECSSTSRYFLHSAAVVNKIIQDSTVVVKSSSSGVIPSTNDSTIEFPLSDHQFVSYRVPELKGNFVNNYGSILLKYKINCRGANCLYKPQRYAVKLISNSSGLILLHETTIESNQFYENRVIVDELSPNWYLIGYNYTQNMKSSLNGDISRSQSRALLLFVLQDLSAVDVLVYDTSYSPEMIKELEFWYEVFTVNSSYSANKAQSLYECNCPPGTTGLFCELPERGKFYRLIEYPKQDILSGKFSVESCECNGLSDTCHPFNGMCLDCKKNTAGQKCELCQSGFYHDKDNRNGCISCKCPTEANNNAISCNNNGTGCKCKVGYIGLKCDQCSDGYYGDVGNGIPCQPCKCNPHGSLHQKCDYTGKCECGIGIKGQKCTECDSDHVPSNQTCISCRSGCTKELFERLDLLEKIQINFVGDPFNSTLTDKLLGNLSDRINFTREVITLLKNNSDVDKLMMKLQILNNNISEIEVLIKHFNYRLGNSKCRLKDFLDSIDDKQNRELAEYRKFLDKALKIEYTNVSASTNELKVLYNQSQLLHNFTQMLSQNATDLSRKTKNLLDKILFLKNGTHSPNLTSVTSDMITQLQMDLNKLKLKFNNLHTSYSKSLSSLDQISPQMDEYNSFLQSMTVEIFGFGTNLNETQERYLLADDVWKVVNTSMREAYGKEFDKLIGNLSNYLASPGNYQLPSDISLANITFFNDSINQALELLNRNISALENADHAREVYKNIVTNYETAKNITLQVNDLVKNSTAEKSEYETALEDIETNIKSLDSTIDIRNEYDKQKDNLKSAKLVLKIHQESSNNFTQSFENLKDNLNTLGDTVRERNITYENLVAKLQKIREKIDQLEKVNPLMDKMYELRDKFNKTNVTLEDVKKSLTKLQISKNQLVNKINKLKLCADQQKEWIAFAHQAAVSSYMPIACQESCTRTYQLYFLQPSFSLTTDIWFSAEDPSQLLPDTVLLEFFSNENNTDNRLIVELTSGTLASVVFKWKGPGSSTSTIQTMKNVITAKKPLNLRIEMYPNKFSAYAYQTDKEALVFISSITDVDWNGQMSFGPRSFLSVSKNFRGCINSIRIQDELLGLDDYTSMTPGCQPPNNPLSNNGKSVCQMFLNDAIRALYYGYNIQNIDTLPLLFTGNGYARIALKTANDGIVGRVTMSKLTTIEVIIDDLKESQWIALATLYSLEENKFITIWKEKKDEICIQMSTDFKINCPQSRGGQLPNRKSSLLITFKNTIDFATFYWHIEVPMEWGNIIDQPNSWYFHIGRLPSYLRTQLNLTDSIPKLGPFGLIQIAGKANTETIFPPITSSRSHFLRFDELLFYHTRFVSIVPSYDSQLLQASGFVVVNKTDKTKDISSLLNGTLDDNYIISLNFLVTDSSFTLIQLKFGNDKTLVVSYKPGFLTFGGSSSYRLNESMGFHSIVMNLNNQNSFIEIDQISQPLEKIDSKLTGAVLGPFPEQKVNYIYIWDVVINSKKMPFKRVLNEFEFQPSAYFGNLVISDSKYMEISSRPVPLKLVEKNFISFRVPVESSIKENIFEMQFAGSIKENTIFTNFYFSSSYSLNISKNGSNLIANDKLMSDFNISTYSWNSFQLTTPNGLCCSLKINSQSVKLNLFPVNSLDYILFFPTKGAIIDNLIYKDMKINNKEVEISSYPSYQQVTSILSAQPSSNYPIVVFNRFEVALPSQGHLKFNMLLVGENINEGTSYVVEIRDCLEKQVLFIVYKGKEPRQIVIIDESLKQTNVFQSPVFIKVFSNKIRYKLNIDYIFKQKCEKISMKVFYGGHPELNSKKEINMDPPKVGCMQKLLIKLNDNLHVIQPPPLSTIFVKDNMC